MLDRREGSNAQKVAETMGSACPHWTSGNVLGWPTGARACQVWKSVSLGCARPGPEPFRPERLPDRAERTRGGESLDDQLVARLAHRTQQAGVLDKLWLLENQSRSWGAYVKKTCYVFQTSQTSQSMPSVYVCGVQVRRETYHTASLGNPIPCHLPVWPPMQVKVLAKGKYAVLIDGFRYLRDDQTLARLISLVGLAAGTLELI